MLQIKQSVSMSRLGKRTHNEDAVYPFLPDSDINEALLQHVPEIKNLYLVCDGVGGSSKGEVASQLACMTFPQYFANFPPDTEGAFSATYLENAVKYVEKTFDQYMERHPESRGMGTTFTLFAANEQGVNLAWAGDSRIYHFRKGIKLYQSEDHSLVNYLIKLGQITEEEARTHKQKNVILRALQGSHAPTQCDANFLAWEKINPGDYFILCSDGMLEGVDNYELERLMGLGLEPHSLIHEIELLCQSHAKDNYSCILIQMGERVGLVVDETPTELVPPIVIPEIAEMEEEETIIMQQPPIVVAPTTNQTPTLLQRLQNESNNIPVEAPVLATATLVSAPDTPKKVLMGNEAQAAIEAPQEAGAGTSWWILSLVVLAIAGGIGYWYLIGRTQFQNSGYQQAIAQAQAFHQQGKLDDALDWADKARNIPNITEAEALDASALVQKINDEKSALRDSAQNPYIKEKIGPGTPHEVKPVPSTTEPSIKEQNKPIIEKPKADDRPPVVVQRNGDMAALENGGGARVDGSLKVESHVSLVKRGYSPAQLLAEAKSYYAKTAATSRKPEDYQTVKEALESLGNNLDGEGAYLLSYMYNQGLTGKADANNALKYAAKSSEKNWVAGQYYHGYLLLKNKSAKDSLAARKLLESAAGKGNNDAKNLLGKLKPANSTKTPTTPTKPAKAVKPTPKDTDDI